MFVDDCFLVDFCCCCVSWFILGFVFFVELSFLDSGCCFLAGMEQSLSCALLGFYSLLFVVLFARAACLLYLPSATGCVVFTRYQLVCCNSGCGKSVSFHPRFGCLRLASYADAVLTF